MEAEIISCEAFAERVGTSSRTVRRKIEAGKIYGDALHPMPGRKIPYLVFDIALKQYELCANKKIQDGINLKNKAMGTAAKPKEPKVEVVPPGVSGKQTPKNRQKAAVKNAIKQPQNNQQTTTKQPQTTKVVEPKVVEPAAPPPKSQAQIEQEKIYDRLAKAKMQSEEHKARLAQLKIEKEEGKLVDAEVAKATIVKLVQETRNSLLNIPDNLGPELLACKDLLDLQTKLTEGINEALLNLSRFSVGQMDDADS